MKTGLISVARRLEGGAETVLRNLLHASDNPRDLVLIAPAQCELDVLAKEKGVQWIKLPSDRDAFLPNLGGFLRILPQLRHLDVIHAWTRRSFDLGWLAGAILRIPFSATLHDFPDAFYISTSRRLLMRLVAPRIQPLVCVSNRLKSALRDHPLGRHAIVIPNGALDFRSSLLHSEETETVRIGFAGMHHPEKGFTMIREWIQTLLGRGMPVRFELFGELHPMWESEVMKLQAAYPGSVNLRGQAPVGSLFADIDILVQASYPLMETFGMILAEAACAGIPVVTSNHGAEPEIVVDGRTGFLFNADQPAVGLDRLILLVKDSVLRTRLGRNARVHFEQYFEAHTMAEKYARMWFSLCHPEKS